MSAPRSPEGLWVETPRHAIFVVDALLPALLVAIVRRLPTAQVQYLVGQELRRRQEPFAGIAIQGGHHYVDH